MFPIPRRTKIIVYTILGGAMSLVFASGFVAGWILL